MPFGYSLRGSLLPALAALGILSNVACRVECHPRHPGCQPVCNPCKVDPLFYGYRQTCWQPWPEEWMPCPPPVVPPVVPPAGAVDAPPPPEVVVPPPAEPIDPEVPNNLAPPRVPGAPEVPNNLEPPAIPARPEAEVEPEQDTATATDEPPLFEDNSDTPAPPSGDQTSLDSLPLGIHRTSFLDRACLLRAQPDAPFFEAYPCRTSQHGTPNSTGKRAPVNKPAACDAAVPAAPPCKEQPVPATAEQRPLRPPVEPSADEAPVIFVTDDSAIAVPAAAKKPSPPPVPLPAQGLRFMPFQPKPSR